MARQAARGQIVRPSKPPGFRSRRCRRRTWILPAKQGKPWIDATGLPGSRFITRTTRSWLWTIWPEAGVRGAEAAWDFYGTVFEALERLTGASGIGDVQLVDAGPDQV